MPLEFKRRNGPNAEKPATKNSIPVVIDAEAVRWVKAALASVNVQKRDVALHRLVKALGIDRNALLLIREWNMQGLFVEGVRKS